MALISSLTFRAVPLSLRTSGEAGRGSLRCGRGAGCGGPAYWVEWGRRSRGSVPAGEDMIPQAEAGRPYEPGSRQESSDDDAAGG